MASSILPRSRNLGLLLLLILLCLYTALTSVFAWVPAGEQHTRIALTTAHYVGFAAVTGCLLSYLWLRTYFRYALGGTLLLGLFNLAAFLPVTFSLGLSFGEAQVGLNPVVLLLLIAFYLLNRAAVNAFFRKHILPAPTTEALARQRRESIDQFKQTFRRKSDENLRQLVTENKLVPDAIAAAQELLRERGTPPQ